MTDITKIPFHGTTIVATEIDGVPHVAVKPVCEAIGLDYSAQYRRIHRQPWATVAMMTTVGADGKNRRASGQRFDPPIPDADGTPPGSQGTGPPGPFGSQGTYCSRPRIGRETRTGGNQTALVHPEIPSREKPVEEQDEVHRPHVR